MKERKFIVSVLVENRFDEIPKVIEYIGQDVDKIINAIIEKHSYGIDEEDQINLSFEAKLNHLFINNGDGCDFILSIIYENKVIFSGAWSTADNFEVVVEKVLVEA